MGLGDYVTGLAEDLVAVFSHRVSLVHDFTAMW